MSAVEQTEQTQTATDTHLSAEDTAEVIVDLPEVPLLSTTETHHVRQTTVVYGEKRPGPPPSCCIATRLVMTLLVAIWIGVVIWYIRLVQTLDQANDDADATNDHVE